MSASGLPYNVKLVPLLAEMLTALAALDTFNALSAAHDSVAPVAVNVRLTGPAATRGVAPKGMAADAPGVVNTVVGHAKLVEALLPLVCVGEARASVVKSLAPLALASSTFSALAEPLYCTGATVVPRKKVCKAEAVPDSTRLDVPDPLTTETLPAAVADKLPEAALKVRVSTSSAALLPSSSAASANSSDEACPLVMATLAGSDPIKGDVAVPAEPDKDCAAVMLAVLVVADCTTPPEITCADTASA